MLTEVPNTLDTTSVLLSGSVLPNVVDQIMYAGDSPNIDARSIVLDLSEAEYIDVPVLIQLCAILRDRGRRRLRTSIRLPEQQRVRDFFRAWNLQPAIRLAAGRPFSHIVVDEDRRFFGEKQRFYLGSERETSHGSGAGEAYQRLLSDRFFGLTPYVLDTPAADRGAIREEWDRWRGPYVRSVLQRHLVEAHEEVPRVVIYELITNALQHPKADLMMVTSRAIGIEGKDGRSPKTRQFTICIWDDGEPIAETLKSAVESGRTIRSQLPTDRDTFKIRPSHWKPSSTSMTSHTTPSAGAEPEEFLISSLFSGISRRATDYPMDEQVGTGLSALYRSVIDTLGGSLAIRSGKDFINVKADPRSSSEDRRYLVKAERIGNRSFLGNLVIARLPLR